MSKKLFSSVTLTLLGALTIGGTCPVLAETITADTQAKQVQATTKKPDNLYQV